MQYAEGKWSSKKAEKASAIASNVIDLTAGELHHKTISAPVTLSVTGALPTGYVSSFILELTNGGAAAVTWWSGVKWAKGTPPTLQAAGVDVLGFYSYNGGTTWHGVVMSQDSK